MASTYNGKIKISVFGQSHSQAIGVVIDNFPAGLKVDKLKLQNFMLRRAPGQKLSTSRVESDEVHFLSGLNENDETCGAAISAIIYNNDVRSKDYEQLKILPRPGHSDYTSYLKFGESRDVRGGGQFSGRLTAPLCIAGFLCKEWLIQKGIEIGAHIYSVQNVFDLSYNQVDNVIPSNIPSFEVLSEDSYVKMKEVIENARLNQDSVGGIVECKVVGVKGGIGEPMFDGIENRLASSMFAIPAVKGFEVGSGFNGTTLFGSQNNDSFDILGDKIITKTNNSGGFLGGITNGMPLIFKVAFKPTPSILKEQQSVNLKTKKIENLKIVGRHDPCIVVRAVPVVEAVTAIVIMDSIM